MSEASRSIWLAGANFPIWRSWPASLRNLASRLASNANSSFLRRLKCQAIRPIPSEYCKIAGAMTNDESPLSCTYCAPMKTPKQCTLSMLVEGSDRGCLRCIIASRGLKLYVDEVSFDGSEFIYFDPSARGINCSVHRDGSAPSFEFFVSAGAFSTILRHSSGWPD